MDLSQYELGASEMPPPPPDAPSAGYPTGGDPVVGLAATTPGAFWFYQLQAELQAVLLAAGMTPAMANLGQLAEAIVALASGGLSFETVVGELRQNGAANLGVRATVVRGDHVHPTDLSRAPVASPDFTGTPRVIGTPPGVLTNTSQIATTAFVQACLALMAPLASPMFTGTPSVSGATPAVGTNTAQIATTAFVSQSLGGRPGHIYTDNDWAWLDKGSGLKVCWGRGFSVDGGGTTTSTGIVFPQAFLVWPPLVFVNVGTTGIYTEITLNTSQGGYASAASASASLTGFNAILDSLGWANFNKQVKFNWFAIGV